MESYIILSFNTLLAIFSLSGLVLEISCSNISDPLPTCDISHLGLPCPGCQSACVKYPCDSKPVCKHSLNEMPVCTAGCHKKCPHGYQKEGFSPSGENFDVYILELNDISQNFLNLRFIILFKIWLIDNPCKPCNKRPRCQNSGICRSRNITDRDEQFECECQKPFYGKYCGLWGIDQFSYSFLCI